MLRHESLTNKPWLEFDWLRCISIFAGAERSEKASDVHRWLRERNRRSLHLVEVLLQDLPVFQAFDFLLHLRINVRFKFVFGRPIDFIKYAEFAGERFVGQFVGSNL